MEGFTYDLNNNGNGGLGGALIGGVLGSWLGNNFGNNRNNGYDNSGIIDSINTMRTDINSIGRDSMLQNGQTSAAIERLGSDISRNQSRTEAAVYTTGLQGQISAKDNTIASLNATHNNEVQALRNTFDLMSSQKDCCCTTNRNIETQGCETRSAIHQDGELTRSLIAQLDRERLLRESAEKDAKIASLESAAQTKNEITNAVNLLLTHITKIAGGN